MVKKTICLTALIVNPRGGILAGYHRYLILDELLMVANRKDFAFYKYIIDRIIHTVSNIEHEYVRMQHATHVLIKSFKKTLEATSRRRNP